MTSTLNRWGSLAAALVLGSGAILGASLAPAEHTAADAVQVKVGAQAVCPVSVRKEGPTQLAMTAATDGITLQPVRDGAPQKLARNTIATFQATDDPYKIIARPGGHAAGMAVTGQGTGLNTGLAAARCQEAGTHAWFVGVSSNQERVSEVVLSNADEMPAEVDLTFYGSDGRLVVKTGHSIVVEPGETQVVAVEAMFTHPSPVTLEVSTPQGRVTSFVREHGLAALGATVGTGVDWHAPSVSPAQDVVIPGVVGGPGPRLLLIANPSQDRAEVSVSLMGPKGAISAGDLSTVAVRPESTAVVDIDQLVGDAPVAVRLTSRTPVTGAVSVTDGATGGDFATATAVEPFKAHAVLPVVTGGRRGTVHLANPGEATSATIRYYDQQGKAVGQPVQLSLGSLAVAQAPVPQGDVVGVSVETDGPVAASLSLQGRTGPLNGVAIVPFRPSTADARYSNPVRDSRVGR